MALVVPRYETLIDELVVYASTGVGDLHTAKIELNREIGKAIKSAVYLAVKEMLNSLYGDDFERLKTDMAKITLIGLQEPEKVSERVAVLSTIWGSLSRYYNNSPVEFLNITESYFKK